MNTYVRNTLRLAFNEKTQIHSVSQGVDYLGFYFYLTDTGKVIRRLRQSGKKRIRKRLRALEHRYKNHEMDLDAIKRSVVSTKGHLRHGHTWHMKKIFGKTLYYREEKNNMKEMKQTTAVVLSIVLMVSAVLGQLPASTRAATSYGISNPVTDSEGVTTWDCIWFGNYWQNNETTKEPIKWRVLSVDGNDAFLLADQNLDCQPYNTEYTSVT